MGGVREEKKRFWGLERLCIHLLRLHRNRNTTTAHPLRVQRVHDLHGNVLVELSEAGGAGCGAGLADVVFGEVEVTSKVGVGYGGRVVECYGFDAWEGGGVLAELTSEAKR